MGNVNKLLLTIDGEPLVRRTARTLLDSGVAGVTIVTGHDATAVWSAVNDLPLQQVHNDAFQQGQMTSVRAGLLSVADVDVVLICPADMPALSPWSIGQILAASATDGARHVIVPTCGGQRGNPIVVPMGFRAQVEAGGVNFGCRNLIANHPEVVRTVALECGDILQDLDTPDAVKAWPGASSLGVAGSSV